VREPELDETVIEAMRVHVRPPFREYERTTEFVPGSSWPLMRNCTNDALRRSRSTVVARREPRPSSTKLLLSDMKVVVRIDPPYTEDQREGSIEVEGNVSRSDDSVGLAMQVLPDGKAVASQTQRPLRQEPKPPQP
jgi:hypothetical protein